MTIRRAKRGLLPNRDASRDLDTDHQGHRPASDATHPRRDFSDRVDSVVWDVAAFRVVALADLITHQFDGHLYVRRPARDRGGGATGVDRTPAGARPEGQPLLGRGGDAGRGGARADRSGGRARRSHGTWLACWNSGLSCSSGRRWY